MIDIENPNLAIFEDSIKFPEHLVLVKDFHFGHLTHIIYARFWKLFITSTIGISGIEELPRKTIDKLERKSLVSKVEKEMEELKEQDELDLELSETDLEC